MILHWIPFAMTDPTVMDGLFSAACRSLALLHKSDLYLRPAFIYNAKCIRSINEAISKKEAASCNDSTIVKILMLASTEVCPALTIISSQPAKIWPRI